MRKIVVFGATSAIASETCKAFAEEEAIFFLVARDKEKLEALKQDLLTRGATRIDTHTCDLSDSSQHEALIDSAKETLSGFDTVLIAHGSLSDQTACQSAFAETRKELETNFLSAISLLTPIANYFEEVKNGSIAVITSVAGDRGRQSNYIYGTAKGALSIFLQGLRNRLSKSGVSVTTIKPGFVDTPMTASFEKGPLFADAQSVGEGIYKAIKEKKDVVYLPWFWRWIMLIIKMIPEIVFKRLGL